MGLVTESKLSLHAAARGAADLVGLRLWLSRLGRDA